MVRERRGPWTLEQRLDQTCAAFADSLTFSIRNRHQYAVELEFKGVTAAGERLEFSAVDLFDIVDGRIKRIKVYWGRIPGRALPVEYKGSQADRSVLSSVSIGPPIDG